MLEICQNAAESTNLAMGSCGHHGLSWNPLSHTLKIILLLSSLPTKVGIKDHHRHNGPSRVSVPLHLNSWNLGTETTSLIFMTNQQYGPSWIRGYVTLSVTAHLVIFPHLPSAASLQCNLRTITSTTDRHKLRKLYFSAFLAQKPLL